MPRHSGSGLRASARVSRSASTGGLRLLDPSGPAAMPISAFASGWELDPFRPWSSSGGRSATGDDTVPARHRDKGRGKPRLARLAIAGPSCTIWLNTHRHCIMLKGADLLAKVKELGDASKSDLVRSCGYVSTKKDGNERLNFTAFYEALLDAKGINLGDGMGKAATKAGRNSAIPPRSSSTAICSWARPTPPCLAWSRATSLISSWVARRFAWSPWAVPTTRSEPSLGIGWPVKQCALWRCCPCR